MPAYGPQLQVNDIVQLTLVSQFAEQIGMNVLHWQVLTVNGGGQDALSLFVTGVGSNGVFTELANCMSSSATYLGCRAQVVLGHPSIAFSDFTNAHAGAVAGSPLPRQTSGIIKKQSAVPGRRTGGRMYVPFPAEASSDANSIPTNVYQGLLVLLGTGLSGLVAWAPGGTAAPVILTRANPSHIPPIVSSARRIQSWTPIQKWATQRRRGSFGRPNISPL